MSAEQGEQISAGGGAEVQAAHSGHRDLYFFPARVYVLETHGFDPAIASYPGSPKLRRMGSSDLASGDKMIRYKPKTPK